MQQPELFVIYKCAACKKYHFVATDFSDPWLAEDEELSSSPVGTTETGVCDFHEAS